MKRSRPEGSAHRTVEDAPRLHARLAGNGAARQTLKELRELQRLAFATIRRPLSRAGGTQRQWTDGRATSAVVSEFIKPNDRLTSLERIEIYNKQYWFRLLDCLHDDYPGLRAILGDEQFRRLRIAYLDRYPSTSFTLRNLGDRLVEFLNERPELIAVRRLMCLDMANFEWAQVVAFDGPALPPLVPDDLLGRDPGKLRLALQPYLTLLEMGFPLDDFVIAVKKQERSLRSEASNAIENEERETRARRIRLPRSGKTFVCVHRHDNELYYKRLSAEEYAILCGLRDGMTVEEACTAGIPDTADAETSAAKIGEWFRLWTELGWLCKRAQ